MPRTLVRRLVLPLLAVLLPLGHAQADDPVLLRLGGIEERYSFVLERFELAVRGLAASQGLAYGPELLAQVYAFMPDFLEQRASEVVLLDQAASRGLVVDEAAADAAVEEVRARFPDEAALDAALGQAGFRDLEHFRSVVAETQLIESVIDAVDADVVIGEQELQVAYAALRPQLTEPEQVCARHILVDTELGAAALGRAANAGADFAAMAQTASIDRGSAASGGDLGCFARGVMVAPFEEASFAAEVGVATGAVASQFGFHTILVYQRIPERTPSLDEVRAPLEQQMRNERVDAVLQSYRRASGIELFPERIPPLEPVSD